MIIMRKLLSGFVVCLCLMIALGSVSASSFTSYSTGSGGSYGQYYTPSTPAQTELWGLTIDKLATRSGPSTTYQGMGTYSVKGQWIKVLSRAWDTRNGIWWVKCEIPYRNEIRVLWTGYKRFDSSTIPLESIPIEGQGSVTVTGSYPVGRYCVVWLEKGGSARSGPGTQYTEVGKIRKNDQLLILESTMGNTGKDWFKVNRNGEVFWVSSGVVTLDGNSNGFVNGVPIAPAK